MRRLLLLLVLAGCSKSSAPGEMDAGRSAAAPPASVARWLAKKPDGTYEIRTDAACAEILAAPLLSLDVPALTPSRLASVVTAPGGTLTVQPLGASFKPAPGERNEPWVRTRGFGHAVTRRSELEWERAYAAYVEEILPFDAMLAHVGERPWGEQGAIETLTVRLYAVDQPLADVVHHVRALAEPVAKVVACKNQKGGWLPKWTRIETSASPAWSSVKAVMPVWYSDYGGNAVVEIHARPANGFTLVAVFFHPEDARSEERRAVLEQLAHP